MSRIGEARVLAFDGKPDEAVAAIKKAIDGGFKQFDAINSDKDLESVRKNGAYKALVEDIVKQEISSFKPFPFDFELKDTSDKPVKLADYKGKITIVDVWGTWCPPCRAEIPHFIDLYKQYKDKGLEIVGINCEQDSPAEVKKTIDDFVKETKIPYRCAVNDGKTEGKIPGFQGYPTTLFLDRSGKVRMLIVGNQGKAKLEAVVTALLAESDKPAEPKAK